MDGGRQPVGQGVDFSQHVQMLDGSAVSSKTAGIPANLFVSEEDWEKPVPLWKLCKIALVDVTKVGQDAQGRPMRMPMEGDDKKRRYVLAKKLCKNESVELTPEELALLNECVTETYKPEAMGAILDALGLL